MSKRERVIREGMDERRGKAIKEQQEMSRKCCSRQKKRQEKFCVRQTENIWRVEKRQRYTNETSRSQIPAFALNFRSWIFLSHSLGLCVCHSCFACLNQVRRRRRRRTHNNILIMFFGGFLFSSFMERRAHHSTFTVHIIGFYIYCSLCLMLLSPVEWEFAWRLAPIVLPWLAFTLNAIPAGCLLKSKNLVNYT